MHIFSCCDRYLRVVLAHAPTDASRCSTFRNRFGPTIPNNGVLEVHAISIDERLETALELEAFDLHSDAAPSKAPLFHKRAALEVVLCAYRDVDRVAMSFSPSSEQPSHLENKRPQVRMAIARRHVSFTRSLFSVIPDRRHCKQEKFVQRIFT